MSSNGQSLRIALLDVDDAPHWEGWTERAWRKHLDRPGDTWDVYCPPKGSIPTIDQVRTYDLVIVGGSHYSCYEDLPWIHQLTDLLAQIVASRIKVLGCCFGQQILSKTLGGKVNKNPSGRFVLTVENVSLHLSALERCQLLPPALAALDGNQACHHASHCHTGINSNPGQADRHHSNSHPGQIDGDCSSSNEDVSSGGVRLPAMLRLLESHGDQVLELPPGACLLASSGTAAHEMWTYDNVVLAFQFHPEMPCATALEHILPRVVSRGKLSEEEAKDSEAKLADGQVDAHIIMDIVRWWARQGCSNPAACAAGAGGGASAGACAASADDATGAGGAGAGAGAAGPAAAAGAAAAAGPAADVDHARPTSNVIPAAPNDGLSSAHPAPSHSPQKQSQQTRHAAQQQLHARSKDLMEHVRGAFDAGLQQANLEYELLIDANGVASWKYAGMADRAVALADFSKQLGEKQQPVQGALDCLPELEEQLGKLAASVDLLDEKSKKLARDVGVPEKSPMFSGWRS